MSRASATPSFKPVIESLEPRLMLAGGTPPPDPADLLDPLNNTVAVIETAFGDIFIEFLDTVVPNTVTNALNYLRDGDWDLSFLHRLVTNFVLQGGGFYYSDADGLTEVPIDDPVANEFDNHAFLTGTGAILTPTVQREARIEFPVGTDMTEMDVGDWVQLKGVSSSAAAGDGTSFLFPVIAKGVGGPRKVDVSLRATVSGASDLEFAFFNPVNVERTIAMAKRPEGAPGGGPDSATSQFFINLANNFDNLDVQNGGFTVFARVVDDASWTVVQAIGALSRDSFNDDGVQGSLDDNLADTPVTSAHTLGDPISEDALVNVVNIEIVKEAGTTEFYDNFGVIPEGFRGSTIVEQLYLVNLEATAANYQVILRTETGNRDEVVDFGTLAGDARKAITLSDFNDATIDLIPEGTPYSIEVQSTTKMAGSLRRSDFGATVGESLFDVTILDDETEPTFKSWTLDRVTRDPNADTNDTSAFTIWTNLTDSDATLTISFLRQGFAPITITKELGAYRRGGLNINDCPWLPVANYSVRITSDQPIVAAVGTYNEDTSGSAAVQRGSLALGMVAGAATEGVLPAAIIAPGKNPFISFQNSSDSTPTIIDIRYVLSDGSNLFGTPVVMPDVGRRRDYDLRTSNINLPENEFFTIVYTTRGTSPPVSAVYTADNGEDATSTPFGNVGAPLWGFADAFYDPARASDLTSVISIFNPFAAGAVTEFRYRLDLHFSDGTTFSSALGTLGARGRVDVDIAGLVASITGLADKINSDPQFRQFSIEVSAFGLGGFTASSGGGVVQYTFSDAAGTNLAFTSAMGGVFDDPLFLDDPVFDGGSGA